ncbi:hypothetical protein BV898_20026 [Hypsibius exemplaris]|uniref:Uncharacterized protein n=1 Tax=Hypsibius exemplaris TaxID=2072580 RepID=A0A9X6RPM0_HYPEX|nr:hypothetical protein BV898_20026 [Hypsibius exemplaris]
MIGYGELLGVVQQPAVKIIETDFGSSYADLTFAVFSILKGRLRGRCIDLDASKNKRVDLSPHDIFLRPIEV